MRNTNNWCGRGPETGFPLGMAFKGPMFVICTRPPEFSRRAWVEALNCTHLCIIGASLSETQYSTCGAFTKFYRTKTECPHTVSWWWYVRLVHENLLKENGLPHTVSWWWNVRLCTKIYWKKTDCPTLLVGDGTYVSVRKFTERKRIAPHC